MSVESKASMFIQQALHILFMNAAMDRPRLFAVCESSVS
jgi:hypothetical protein